jgi:hypothetical protein
MSAHGGGAPFVTGLRARPEPVALAPEGAREAWTIRVQCLEAWDAVRVHVLPTTPVRDVKAAAIAALLDGTESPDGYVAKLRGVELRDESLPLRDAGVVNGSTLLVMSRRRRPLR